MLDDDHIECFAEVWSTEFGGERCVMLVGLKEVVLGDQGLSNWLALLNVAL